MKDPQARLLLLMEQATGKQIYGDHGIEDEPETDADGGTGPFERGPTKRLERRFLGE